MDNWRRKIDSASNEELWLAAEALVDAALCKQEREDESSLNEDIKVEISKKRLSLIAAVNNDPKLIEWLFCPCPKQLN